MKQCRCWCRLHRWVRSIQMKFLELTNLPLSINKNVDAHSSVFTEVGRDQITTINISYPNTSERAPVNIRAYLYLIILTWFLQNYPFNQKVILAALILVFMFQGLLFYLLWQAFSCPKLWITFIVKVLLVKSLDPSNHPLHNCPKYHLEIYFLVADWTILVILRQQTFSR